MFKIYYTDPVNDKPYSWDEETLAGALTISEQMRKAGMRFVTTVSENPDVVGKPGVDAVVAGVLPDGTEYTWKKRRP
jgi:hypothetical protein